MNWFGWFRKSNGQNSGGDTAGAAAVDCAPDVPAPDLPPPAPTTTPDEIRTLLFDAVAAGDDARLEALCREHKDLILSHAAGWLEVPDAYRASPQVYEWYGNGLRAVASFCADKLGRDDVLPQLAPGAATSAGHQ